jgi:hypothetical protein
MVFHVMKRRVINGFFSQGQLPDVEASYRAKGEVQ